MKTIRYAAESRESPLAPFRFERRDLRPNDVPIEEALDGKVVDWMEHVPDLDLSHKE